MELPTSFWNPRGQQSTCCSSLRDLAGKIPWSGEPVRLVFDWLIDEGRWGLLVHIVLLIGKHSIPYFTVTIEVLVPWPLTYPSLTWCPCTFCDVKGHHVTTLGIMWCHWISWDVIWHHVHLLPEFGPMCSRLSEKNPGLLTTIPFSHFWEWKKSTNSH